MRVKGVEVLQRLRPMRAAALPAALALGILAVVSIWALQAAGDYRVFGPAIFGGAGEPPMPEETTTSTATATATGGAPGTPTSTTTATPTTTGMATATATITATATATATDTPTPTTTATDTPTTTPTSAATATATRTLKPTRTPKATATATLTPSPTATLAPGEELLVFDWNKPVTVDDHGFPWDRPPLANGDWTQPINFAAGTLYLRVEIFDQPVPQEMKMEFCVWQANNTLENCSSRVAVSGESGTVVTWNTPVKQMWKKNGQPINWALPRTRNGVAIRNSSGDPVSDFSGWGWSGENPAEWYPLDMRFTVVVVEKGAGFSGWDTYIP